MFDLSAEKLDRPFRRQARGARSISVILHAVVSTLVIGVPLLTATDVMPEVQAMKVFISAPPAPPPPPPPPPPRADKPRPKPAETPTNRFAAPIEAPLALVVEPSDYASQGEGEFEGVEGGVEGGVAGGVLGGVIGGLVAMPPPPPPAPPQPKLPVRIGGQISSPAVIKRVEPKYPDIAAAAKLTGLVILEALVNEAGEVETVKTLRSPNSFLEKAAVEALREWQYSPLVLDGVPMSFILTVTFNFSVK